MNIRQLDLNLLKVLEAVFDEQRTTLAAARLGMSQPAVSHALNKLRTALGDSLFVREGNRMLPTPYAESIREPVKRVLQIISSEIAADHTFDPKTTHRRFTISTSDIGELVFLPQLLSALATEAPNATLRCLSMPPRELEEAMADGTVDIALGYFPDLTGGGFYQQKLFEHRFVCLVRVDHPVFGDTITLEEFLAADHAVVAQEGRSQEIFERRMQQLGLERRILLQSPHFMSAPLLVAASDMIITVPRAVGNIYRRLAPIRLIEPPIEIPPFELKQLWHRRVHADLAVIWLRTLIARLSLNRDPSEDENHPLFRLETS
jgi:DNA-binding transcriptional LysR family regulator